MNKWIRFFMLFFLVISSALYVFAILHFAFFFEEYRFGTEVAGLQYYSPWHYGGINGALAVIGVGALLFPWIATVKRVGLVRLSALCLLVVGAFVF